MEIVAFILAIWGLYLNIKKNPWGFALWAVSDVLWVIYFVNNHDLWPLLMCAIFAIYEVYGFWNWKTTTRKEGDKEENRESTASS